MAANAINIGNAERIGSVIGGTALVLRALARPSPARVIAAIGGAALLQRGLTGHCALYNRLGLDTAVEPAQRPIRRRAAESDSVTVASEDSFPASDPPSWTPVAGTAR
jgi:uncharacterized membrane protein